MPGWSDHILCWLARCGPLGLRELRPAPPAAGWSEAGGAVREPTQQAGVAVMAGVFLDHMNANPAQGYLAAAFGGKSAIQRIAAIASRESSHSIISEA